MKKALSSLGFLVVQEIFMSETAKFANVVLPGASFFEKSGTFTNGGRGVQRVNEVIPPLADAEADGQSRRRVFGVGFCGSAGGWGVA